MSAYSFMGSLLAVLFVAHLTGSLLATVAHALGPFAMPLFEPLILLAYACFFIYFLAHVRQGLLSGKLTVL